MSQVITKFVADNAIIGTKIRLANNQALRARNAANSADVNLILLDPSDNAAISTALGVSGNISAANFSGASSGTNTGDITLAAVGSSPNANGASLSGQSLNLQSFDSTHPGVVTASGGGTTNFLRADGTWAPAGAGSGANQQLSNLSGIVAINMDLIFDTGSNATVKTKADTATKDLYLQSGASSAGASGIALLGSGTAVGGASGDVFLQSGQSDTAGGNVSILSGNPTAADINSGVASLLTGAATGIGNSGNIAITSGSVAAGVSGNITLTTGDTDATQNSGNISLVVGNGGSLQEGKIIFSTGDATLTGYVWTDQDGTGSGKWQVLPTAAVNEKQLFTLSGTDITNQYIDLDHVASTDSIDFLVKGGGIQIEGASYDYSVNYTGGAGGFTRITFLNDLATGGVSALIAGDVVVVKFQHI